MALELIENKIRLSTIQKQIKGGSKQVDFLISVFPSFLNKSSLDVLYFIFNDSNEKLSSSVKRTMSDFINGNYKNGVRKQKRALDYLSTKIREKGNILPWVSHLEKEYPSLSVEAMRSIANTDIDLYPDSFKSVIVNEHNCYFLLLFMVCWSVFGERIEECNFQLSTYYSEDKLDGAFKNDDDFFKTMFAQSSNIERIDMAYHSGYKWLYNTNRANMLANYLAIGGHLRVIVNSQKAASIIAKHTNNPNKEYIGFKKSADAWKRLTSKYPDSITLFISDIPLMHSFVHFKFKEELVSRMLVIFYTYGNSIMPQNYHLFLDSNKEEYSLFDKEFEYLITHD